MRIAVAALLLSAFLPAFLIVAGCAHEDSVQPRPVVTRGADASTEPPATKPTDDPAYFTLEQIQPIPKLPQPATSPTTAPAPLDALQWFAQARAADARGDRNTAINLLEKAIVLDPGSSEMYEELGKAYGAQDKALTAFEKALAIDPDNLSLHERLGRQYLIKNRVDDALLHFRLALKTSDYNEDNESAAVVDFFLARALQRKGYDRAALDQYAKLVKRLDHPSVNSRSNPELLSLLSQPEVLYGQIGELYAKHKEYDDAVKAYELAVERQPDNFDFQQRLTRALADAGQGGEAEKRAQMLVSRFRANADSLKLLREIYQRTGHENQIVAALTELRKERPNDPALLFALADALKQSGRLADAERLLLDQAKRGGDADGEILRRVFAMYDQRDDVDGAVRLLVNALAANPDSFRQIWPLWADLLKPSRRNRVRLPVLQKLKVAPESEASRLFWVSRVADVWNRDAMARAALEQGVQIKPPFPPTYRALLAEFWARPDWDDSQRIAESDKLIASAREQGNPALAAELEGLSLFHQKKFDAAADKLAESIRLGNKAPDVQLTQAIVLRRAGNGARSEQLLWKVVSDTPSYEDAYLELFGYYAEQTQPAKAVNVLSKWLTADPGNVRARLLRARLMQQAGRADAAETELLSLFHDDPESPEVLVQLHAFYSEGRRIEEYITKLEEERKARPENREAAEMLVQIYHEQNRLPEALRVLDATRDAVRADPDLLYYIAHVYGRIDQKQTEEQLLEEVVKLDPANAPASNDLGYGFADAGKNLARAEDLIRVAVDAEPDNQSFLDSLGWVLYKRSKFPEALTYFERAIGPATRPDPVVLDHMGDVLYRLNQPADAVKQWKRAQQRLDQTAAEREDLKKLRLQLMQKLRQQENGQPVDVAPVAETTPAASQAKTNN